MAVSQLHAAPHSENTRPGPITAGLLKWQSNGPNGPRPFGGANGPDAASAILLKTAALTSCLSASFSDSHANHQSEFAALVDDQKSLAMSAIGDLILLAKVLTDEE
jgi:hypothetical protein